MTPFRTLDVCSGPAVTAFNITEHLSDSYSVSIFVAGDYATALQACREHCMTMGLCVTVTATKYAYTGGCETGVIVGLINYPRFPSTPDEMDAKARGLATLLIIRLCQHSSTIQTPRGTIWLSRRPTP